MNMNGNIASGGMGGGTRRVELKREAPTYLPGMPRATMHSATARTLGWALGKAPTLSRLADPHQRASTPPIMGRDDMVIDEHRPIQRVESMLFGEKAFPVLPPTLRTNHGGLHAPPRARPGFVRHGVPGQGEGIGADRGVQGYA